MKKLVTVFICFSVAFANGQVYNPSLHTVSNDAIGFGQATPADGRTMFWDATNFRWRDFQSTAEVLSTLPTFANRYGHSFISVHSGGSLQSNGTWIGGISNLYWFRNGTADSNLVQMPTDLVSTAGFFQVANNLSEGVPSTMRSNLGLGTMSTQNIAAGGTNLSGNWPDPVVLLFNSQPASFYLNYNNLSNRPAQLNPTAAGLDSISGTFPNLTWTGRTPGWEQTLIKNNALSKTDTVNMGAFGFRFIGTGPLGFPRGNTSQRPSSPAVSDGFYNTDSLFLEIWNGSAWKGGTGSGGGGGGGITAGTGPVTFSGSGSVATTITPVNSNVFGSNTFLAFSVMATGQVGSARAVIGSDITGALGFTPYNATNPAGYIPLTALSATSPLAYNNTTGVYSMPAAATAQNGYLTSTDWNTFSAKLTSVLTNGNIFVGNGSNVAASVTPSGDWTMTNTGVSTIANNAITTIKINNAAVTYAKIQNAAGSSVLLGAQSPGVLSEITLGTNLSMSGGVLNATTAGAQTLTYTQNATNNNLAISGGNSQNFLVATHLLAGLLDTARATYIDSLKNGLKTFNIFTLNGLSQTGGDTLLFGGSLIQNTTLATAGFAMSVTGLPNKSSALGTDSLLIENAAGQWFKLPIVTGGITQLTGDVTAGPGSGSQASTISALSVTTGKIANGAVTTGKMSSIASNNLFGSDGSGNPGAVSIGPGLSLSGLTLSATGGGSTLLTRQSITSGTSATGTAPNLLVTFNFPAPISGYAFTMPASPTDQQVVEFEGGGTLVTGTEITTLTLIANTSQLIISKTPLNTFDVGDYAKFKWNASISTWMREN